MKNQNFEKDLPQGYKELLHIDAKNAKTGIIMNLVAFGILAVVMAVAYIPLALNDIELSFAAFYAIDSAKRMTILLVFCVVSFAYIVLHELVHGIAYKSMTGERLTFGISWSCAFCGVPNIYTYRKTAIVSSAAPLAVFSVIFGLATIAMFFVSPIYYLLSAVVFGLHLGGCSGDMYIILLLSKYKDPRVLVRDTGPEQFLYIPM